MPISTDPSVLAAASRCFDTCIPPGDQAAVKTYLLAQITGITDPAAVLNGARCFNSCISVGALPAVQAYEAAVLAGGSTDPSTVLNEARCFLSCIPPGANAAVANYSLASLAGGSMDPSTLANAARCFSSCIPPGFQMAAQTYLMAVETGGSTDPGVILTNASNWIGTIPPGNPDIPDIMITRWATGGTTCPPMTVGSLVLDTFETYTNGASISGLNGGTGWCSTSAYVIGINTVGDVWANKVFLNGGSRPSQNTIDAANDFNTAITPIKSRIYHANFIAPDNLIAALTPFIATYGNPLWVKQSVGVPPAESITINGLLSATNDTNGIVYDTGIAPSGIAAFSLGNQGLSVYCADAVIATSNNPLAGCFDSVASSGLMNLPDFGGQFLGVAGLTANGVLVGHAAIGGFYMISRSAVGSLTGWFANSTNLWGAIGNNALNNAAALNTERIGSGGLSRDAAWTPSAVSRVSFMAIHDGFISADGQTLFNAVQAVRVKIGGGFV